VSRVRDFLVYALLDPVTREVRYIGKSSSGLARAKAHLEPAYSLRHKGYKKNWLLALRNAGQLPAIIVLSRHTSNEEVLQAEIDYIRLYRALGARLTNQTDGGEGTCGRVVPAEERLRSANSRRGLPRSPETLEKIKQTKLANGTWNAPVPEQRRLQISETLRRRGGTHIRGTNKRTGEVCMFKSIRAAKQAGHSIRAIENQTKQLNRRIRKRPAYDWLWEIVDAT
jgi:hypothetical protein